MKTFDFFCRFCCLFLLFLFIFSDSVPAEGGESLPAPSGPCAQYSDAFDIYNIERWNEVLLYSENRGAAAVEDGKMMLQALETQPVEIQIYSLFTFRGDFDVQIDYRLQSAENLKFCRFNAGMVFQTLDDELSYKCYVSRQPGTPLIFRSRLDQFGEKKLEKHKGGPAPSQGTLRITRTRQTIAFFYKTPAGWQFVHRFDTLCRERMRLRLKLQTGDETTRLNACPTTIYFDNFTVNSCDTIIEE